MRLILLKITALVLFLFTFHAISSLVFSVLGLAPSSSKWALALTLQGFLAIAGAAGGLWSLKRLPQQLTAMVSGAASVAILGVYSFGQLSGQRPQWAISGAVIGLIIGGILGFLTAGRQRFWSVALAITGSLCAYGAAFGFGAWTFAAINVYRWDLALGLGLLTGVYLWFTKQALSWTYRQWRQCFSRE